VKSADLHDGDELLTSGSRLLQLIGVGRAGSPAPPPSEPDGRVSRIRLSG
jgi:hypothetical protein